MEEKNYTGIIPDQYTGKEINTEATIELGSEEEAKSFFKVAKARLIDVNNWHQVAGTLSATFQLVDKNGQEVQRPVQKSDYFKIDIPGPGPKAGEGFDWVTVEEMIEVNNQDVESTGIRVRPTSSPLNANEDVAHFYSTESNSSFIVTRENKKVIATVSDTNTKPNKDSESLTDKIRDVAVGMGALSAFSKIQWQHLVDGLIKKEN